MSPFVLKQAGRNIVVFCPLQGLAVERERTSRQIAVELPESMRDILRALQECDMVIFTLNMAHMECL